MAGATPDQVVTAAENLAVDVANGLTDFGVEELQHILDGVREQHARAPLETVLSELYSFRRVRELAPGVVHRLADDVAEGRASCLAHLELAPEPEQRTDAWSSAPAPPSSLPGSVAVITNLTV